MSLTYASYVQRVMDQADSLQSDVNVSIAVPGMIDYAEQRIYRELNLLDNTAVVQGQLTLATRSFTIPTPSGGRFISIRNVTIYPDAQTGTPLIPCSLGLLNALFPPLPTGLPTMYAMVTDTVIYLGPLPDSPYPVEVIGTKQPTALSAANPTTVLSLYFPELLVGASLIYLAKMNGVKVDATTANAFEAQYVALRDSAVTQEVRKKYNETFVGTIARPETSGGRA